LLIEETCPLKKELYIGILVDRAEGKPVFMASAAAVSKSNKSPQKIRRRY